MILRTEHYKAMKAKKSNLTPEDIQNAKPKPFWVMKQKEVENKNGTMSKLCVFEPETNEWDGTKWSDTTLKALADGGVDLEARPMAPKFFQQSIDSLQSQLGELQEHLDYYKAMQESQSEKQTTNSTTENQSE